LLYRKNYNEKEKNQSGQSYKTFLALITPVFCKLNHFINVKNCLSVAKRSSLQKDVNLNLNLDEKFNH
jgi:hypothetical protein